MNVSTFITWGYGNKSRLRSPEKQSQSPEIFEFYALILPRLPASRIPALVRSLIIDRSYSASTENIPASILPADVERSIFSRKLTSVILRSVIVKMLQLTVCQHRHVWDSCCFVMGFQGCFPGSLGRLPWSNQEDRIQVLR